MNRDQSRAAFRALLAECELTQRALAQLLGRTRQAVSMWVTGAEGPPEYAVAFLLAFRLLDPNGRVELRRRILEQRAAPPSNRAAA